MFWLETLQGQSAPTQLQYAQTVLLNFNGLSWPHITSPRCAKPEGRAPCSNSYRPR